MSSESDGELEARFSSMKQPPLIKQLKGILSEYPDGGQIIKELLQNAEDAGASEVHIICDSREINQDDGLGKAKEYRKFFQGPAMCVYNNALFSDKDWEGVQMIYSSVKEDDRLKVGRFGLGFKSVFHLTDYPCILSGDTLLLIDPQQPRDKVNAEMKIKQLNRYKGMDVEAFMLALCGIFEIDRDLIQRGSFNGTLFWFPLRRTESVLSSNIYSEARVRELFDIFSCETQTILLFLRHLTNISLSVRRVAESLEEIASVKLANGEDVKHMRDDFNKTILGLPNCYRGQSVYSFLKMDIECTSHESEDRRNMRNSLCTWLVLNYFIGECASSKFRALIEDSDLSFSPYVGIAAPIGEILENGHVFCFLPLPREGSRLTGLPVHVNGFFALNQSRHHLRWATDEQIGHQISEKAIQWNECLIREALPKAYLAWFEHTVQYAEDNGNTIELVACVQNAIPNKHQVELKWQNMLKYLFEDIKSKRVIFSLTSCKWLKIQSVYVFSENVFKQDLEYKTAILKAAKTLKLDCAEVSDIVYKALTLQTSLSTQILTPEALAQKLRKQNVTSSLVTRENMFVLKFLLSCGNTKILDSLQMLPLESGKWAKFSSECDPVFVCTEEEISIFPGLEDRFLRSKSELSDEFHHKYQGICNEGNFQLSNLGTSDIQKLLQMMTQNYFTVSPGNRLMTGKLPFDWLKQVWHYLQKHDIIFLCQTVPLFPLIQDGSNNHTEVIKLQETVILKQYNQDVLSEEICACLRALGVDIISSLPQWISPSAIADYIKKPSQISVTQVMGCIFRITNNLQKHIEAFNRCETYQRTAFMLYLADYKTHSKESLTFMRKLKIFKARISYTEAERYVSVEQNAKYTLCKTFPVRYPRYLINEYDTVVEQLLIKLGCKEMKLHEMFKDTFNNICSYNTEEIKVIMGSFLTNYNSFKRNLTGVEFHEVKRMASTIAFLPLRQNLKKPSELFSPADLAIKNLFLGQDVFPTCSPFPSTEQISILEELGLKVCRDVKATDLLDVARMLETWSKSSKESSVLRSKSKAFVLFLSENPSMLEDACGLKTLKAQLKDISCIEYLPNPPERFPSWIPWFSQKGVLCRPKDAKTSSMSYLVGSVMPLVKSNSARLVKAFGWNQPPNISKVILQLFTTVDNYKEGGDTQFYILLGQLYERLCQCPSDELTELRGKNVVWNGNGFSNPDRCVMFRNNTDIELKPYFYFIPKEIQAYKSFLEHIGCRKSQGVNDLIETLEFISKLNNYDLIYSQTLELAIKIVERLAERQSEIPANVVDKILLPIRTDDQVPLTLMPLNECTYDDNPERYIQNEESVPVNFVHKRISGNVANALRIKSWLRTGLSETEELGVEEWGQEESLTDRIKGLLEGYRDGLSVPKELIQNADDAGATVVKILYDQRENLDQRKSLLHSAMSSCQGPALWVFNDAQFTEEDFKNIVKLNGATKQNKEKKIGKFGLGFCSVYNITDVPSFVSGNNVVILDPHRSHLNEALPGNSPGLKIDLQRPRNRDLVRRNKDQFQPYNNVFGCNLLNAYFNGTLFRFPFRTKTQAMVSKISQTCYSDKEVQELLQMLIKTAGNLLLFVQSVRTIEIYHLPRNSTSTKDQNLIFTVSRRNERIIYSSSDSASDSGFSLTCSRQDGERTLHSYDISMQLSSHSRAISHIFDRYPEYISQCWIVSLATGKNKTKSLKEKNSTSLSAVAVPCLKGVWNPVSLESVAFGTYHEGHMFCYLPLPKKTGLPWHLHGCFETTSDRRNLPIFTEDDKQGRHSEWNDNLLSDTAVNAFIELLLFLSKQITSADYIYHQLWPLDVSNDMKMFKSSFYSRLLTENQKLFKGLNEWISFKNVVFLHPDIRENQMVGDVAFQMIAEFQSQSGQIAVDIPRHVYDEINTYNTKKVMLHTLSEVLVVAIFLRNIDDLFWENKPDRRNKLTLYALRMSNDDVESMLKLSKCIPCEFSRELLQPCEVVSPVCELSALFKREDGRFPKLEFCKQDILQRLETIGMLTKTLPQTLLFERCRSIPNLGKQCYHCALERIKSIVKYLSKDDVQIEFQNNPIARNEIQMLHILPVLSCPRTWEFPWYSTACDSVVEIGNNVCKECTNKPEFCLRLGRPSDMLREDVSDMLGSVAIITDENWRDIHSVIKEKVLGALLEVKGRNDLKQLLDKVVNQMCIVTDQYCIDKYQYTTIEDIMDKLLDSLRVIIARYKEEDYLPCLEVLKTKRVVLIGRDLVMPSKVAFHVKEECLPVLCKLPFGEQQKREQVYLTLGVRRSFDANYIINEMRHMKTELGNKPCNEIEKAIKLLINLEDTMITNKLDFTSIEQRENIFAPDSNGVLRPTYELVVDDDTFQTTSNVHIVNNKIAPALAFVVGVNSKRNRCVHDISVGIPFGQKEELTNRLKSLLQAYPFGVGIMKELLQNADDAGATELHFVKDFRRHSATNILVNEKFQGPSLLVYNNSYFTEKDLKGIHDLGLGSKKRDPTKTGQYGVGFNALYHLTDTPSFYSTSPTMSNGGILCVFDPTCCNIPNINENEPGMMYYKKDIRTNFPNQLIGFSETELMTSNSETGTIFRLPLRTECSSLSSNICTQESIKELLSSFADDMQNAMIFLKNVRKIIISDITSGSLNIEYSITASVSEDDERELKAFSEKFHAYQFQDVLTTASTTTHTEVRYNLRIENGRNRAKDWLVVQRLGLPEGISFPEDLRQYILSGALCQIPIGGIALPFDKLNGAFEFISNPENLETNMPLTENSFSGNVFTFLPLPGETGLPVHVNGHFVLDHEARQGLWKSDYRLCWNEFLIQHVIIPCMVSAITYVIKHVFIDHNPFTYIRSWKQVKYIMRVFHGMFPVTRNNHDCIWLHFVKAFYTFIQKHETCVFPVVLTNESNAFSIKWVPLISNCHHGAVFSVVQAKLALWEKDQLYKLENTLKQIGVNLIATPSKIMNSAKECGLKDILESDPDFVMRFLQKGEGNMDRSDNEWGVCSVISSTRFKTAECLRLVVAYIIKSKTFAARFNRLPVILTADNVLRMADINETIYNSIFWRLLPNSTHMFLHESLLSLLLPITFDKQFIFHLGVAEFLSIIPYSIPENKLKRSRKVKWYKERKDPLSTEWIAQFFQFLYYESFEYSATGQTSYCNQQKFRKHLDMFADWSFLPTIDNHADGIFALTPLCMPFSMFYDDHYDKNVNIILIKFGLPMLDYSIFTDPSPRYVLSSVLACSTRPYSILVCLYENIERILPEKVEVEDALTLMEFFKNNLKKLSEENDNKLKEKIQRLPFFITYNRMKINVNDRANICLLPEGMPRLGIEEWANATDITLLEETDKLMELFNFLGFDKTSVEDMYVSKVLPTLDFLPREHWLDHISYIKSNLLQTSFGNSFSPVQLKLISHLAELDFIPVGNGFRRPEQFFDKDVEVFECMVDQSYLLPKEFYKDGWKEFLITLGLKHEVTIDLFLHFAEQVHMENSQICNNETLQKSKVLIRFFLASLSMTRWPSQKLRAVGNIPFIIPHVVCEQMSEIFPQVGDKYKMIAFEGSTSFWRERVCWSTMNLLPRDAIPNDKEIRQMLGIQEFPPVKHVITHCLNICHSMETLLKEKMILYDTVYNIMKAIYDYLDKHLVKNVETSRERLKHTPFICIRENNVLVKTSQVVSNLEKENEIKPYLYKVPLELGPYWCLFNRLGASENVTCGHFVTVFKLLHRKTGGNDLCPQELFIAALCIQQLERHLMPDQEFEGPLYLPNRNRVLKESTTLVLSNNDSLEGRLTEGHLDLDFFIGHDQLEIAAYDPTRLAGLLPGHMKPLLLTEIISERIEMNNVFIHEDCERALKLSDFLHSKELIEGIVRLVVHEQSNCDESEIARIQHNLESIKVRRISGLKTLCYYNGVSITGSSMTKSSFIKKEQENGNTAYGFYFDIEDEVLENVQELLLNDDGVHDLVKACVTPLSLNSRLLIAILYLENVPTKIKDTLDRSGIHMFRLNNVISVFPTPGTYVEDRFHSFLEQEIVAFDKQDFRIIALELEDNASDNSSRQDIHTSAFIYVRIIREVECCSIASELQRRYLVITGSVHSTPVEIPIHRLYRFVRPEAETHTCLTVYDEQPNVSFTFDSNCKRIKGMLEDAWSMPLEDRKKIVKRLLLKWHPDKNIRNKEYCKHVFIFIKHAISLLESNLSIDETLQTNVNSDASSQFDSPYYDICRNIDRQAEAHFTAYHEHLDEYNRFYRTGRYSNVTMQRSKVPDISRAKQWLRQAKNDFRVAELYFPDIDVVDGFNWICYTCHQACEKSLKAASFNIDRNSVPARTHSLTEIAHGIDNSDVSEKVRQLEQRLGEHTRMRYPDGHQYQRIPSDIFNKDDAEFSLQTAKYVIDFADESIG